MEPIEDWLDSFISMTPEVLRRVCVAIVLLLLGSFALRVSALAAGTARGYQTVKPLEVPVGEPVCVVVTFEKRLPLGDILFTNVSWRTSGVYEWPRGPSEVSMEGCLPLGAEWAVVQNVTHGGVNVQVRPRYVGRNTIVIAGPVPRPKLYGYGVAEMHIFVEGKARLSALALLIYVALLSVSVLSYAHSYRALR